MEKIDGHDAYRVVGLRPDGSAVDRLYFDAQTGLLLRSYTTMQASWERSRKRQITTTIATSPGSRFPTRCES